MTPLPRSSSSAPGGPIAVLDVGSNSIKLLVARAAPGGRIATIASRTLDARISRGISGTPPRLSEEGMRTGLGAIGELLALADEHRVSRKCVVATSAVRDAANGGEFRNRVLQRHKVELRILSGDEEARLIGLGLLRDPSLASLSDFMVFDLGGGSLECLQFKAKRATAALSLPLGCVRLTEIFVKDPSAPVSPEALAAVDRHVRESLAASGFRFDPGIREAVLSGGTVTTARAILANAKKMPIEALSPDIGMAELRAMLTTCAPLATPDRRMALPGLPASRADVFPVALATLIAVADLGGVERFHHSFFNLRYGIAAEMLALGGTV